VLVSAVSDENENIVVAGEDAFFRRKRAFPVTVDDFASYIPFGWMDHRSPRMIFSTSSGAYKSVFEGGAYHGVAAPSEKLTGGRSIS
jgi:hypothetical protein